MRKWRYLFTSSLHPLEWSILMLDPIKNMTKLEKKLLSIYRKLDQQSQTSLFDFAEFLLDRTAKSVPQITDPPESPTPETPSENESVIAAIKRLQRSYKMLDTSSLFNEASGLMSAHMVQGRPADEVIAELEVLFDSNYQSYLLHVKSGQ